MLKSPIEKVEDGQPNWKFNWKTTANRNASRHIDKHNDTHIQYTVYTHTQIVTVHTETCAVSAQTFALKLWTTRVDCGQKCEV